MTERIGFRESRTAQELADAFRNSYVTRQAEGDSSAEVTAITANLLLLGDIEHIPPVAKPGLAAVPIRFLRSILRAFLRPWLNVQTMFNHDVARRYQVVAGGVVALERRAPRLEESLHALERRLQMLERGAASSSASATRVAPDLAGLERMFVHMQLPRPPARVLVIDAADVARELSAFGFETSAFETASGAIPFRAASFDVVILLRAHTSAGDSNALDVTAEPARVLKPGGRLVMTMAPGQPVPPAFVAAEGRESTVRVAGLMVGELHGDAWRVTACPPAEIRAVAAAAREHMLMLHALRVDVSDR